MPCVVPNFNQDNKIMPSSPAAFQLQCSSTYFSDFFLHNFWSFLFDFEKCLLLLLLLTLVSVTLVLCYWISLKWTQFELAANEREKKKKLDWNKFKMTQTPSPENTNSICAVIHTVYLRHLYTSALINEFSPRIIRKNSFNQMRRRTHSVVCIFGHSRPINCKYKTVYSSPVRLDYL